MNGLSIYFNYYTNTPIRYFGHNYYYGYDHYDVYNGFANASYRAPIFYDQNDTGYYGDYNGVDNQGIRMRGGIFHGPNWSWGAYMRVGTNGRIDGYGSAVITNGNLHLDCQNGYETYINHYSGQRTYLYEIRTNFIYDRDSTGYYMDINGANQFNSVYSDGWFRPQGGTGLYFQSYGRGIWAPDNSGSSYGNVATYGGGRNGWYGYAVDSTHCLMTTTGDNFGLHDNRYGWVWLWDGSRFNVYRGSTYISNYMTTPIYLDYNDGNYYCDPNGNQNFSYITDNNGGYSRDGGQFYFTSNRGYYNHYTNSPPLQAYSDYNYAAFMSFHRSGHYAINEGLDADNLWRMGGWSAQAWFVQIDMGGYAYFRGYVYYYYSDERLKNILGRIPDALDKISQLDGFYYRSNELALTAGGYDDSYKLQVGLSAQQVQRVMPEIVSLAPFDTYFPDPDDHSIVTSKSGENYLTVAYDKMVPLLVEGIKELKDEIATLKNRVTQLETEVTELKS